MIAFEHPAAFALLAAIPALYVLRRLRVLQPPALPLTFYDWNGRVFVWNSAFQMGAHVLSRLLLVLAYVSLVIACASPVRHFQQKVYSSRGADVLFVVDTSPSMAARDIAGMTRLEAAKQAIRMLEGEHKGCSVGLVEMAREAAVVVPPTMDHELFLRKLDGMVVGELGDGTAIGTGLSCAVFHLESSRATKKSIVLITDGENNAGDIHPHTAARLARDKHISLAVLGIGTRGSVPLEYSDPLTGKTRSGLLRSEYDVASLARIAAEAGGSFYEVETMGALSQALEAVGKSDAVAQSYRIKSRDVRYYGRFLYAAGILCALGVFIQRFVLKEVL